MMLSEDKPVRYHINLHPVPQSIGLDVESKSGAVDVFISEGDELYAYEVRTPASIDVALGPGDYIELEAEGATFTIRKNMLLYEHPLFLPTGKRSLVLPH